MIKARKPAVPAPDLTVLDVHDTYRRKDPENRHGVVSTLMCAGRKFPCRWSLEDRWNVTFGRRTVVLDSWHEVVTAVRTHVHRVDRGAVPRAIRQREESAAIHARIAAEIAAENAAAEAAAEQATATLARSAEARRLIDNAVDRGWLKEEAADYADANHAEARRWSGYMQGYLRARGKDWHLMTKGAARDIETYAGRCIELAERLGLMAAQAA